MGRTRSYVELSSPGQAAARARGAQRGGGNRSNLPAAAGAGDRAVSWSVGSGRSPEEARRPGAASGARMARARIFGTWRRLGGTLAATTSRSSVLATSRVARDPLGAGPVPWYHAGGDLGS